MANVIIIGSGPAGVSASLYTIRGGLDTTIISLGQSALLKADLIENYYGFSKPISGKDLSNQAIEGAKRLGVKFIEEEVVNIEYLDKLYVETTKNKYPADFVIIATGVARSAPNIKGLKEFEGSGVSYCAICDAFFYKGKDVAILGNGEYALHELNQLKGVVKSVTLLTNGSELTATFPDDVIINQKKIKEITGNFKVEKVVFEDDTSIDVAGLFVAYGTAGSTSLAKKIGAETLNNKIVVNANMETNIPNLYAIGDTTGGLLQVSKAVYEGAKAGSEIVRLSRTIK